MAIDPKPRVAACIYELMRILPATQQELARKLRVHRSRISRYLTGKELPSLDVLVEISNLLGVALDDILKTDTPIDTLSGRAISPNNKQSISIVGDYGAAIIAERDAYYNTTVLHRHKYVPQPDDISPDQARSLKDIVEEIVSLEKRVRAKPKGYGAVWNALNKKLGVTYYREIKKEYYQEAEFYLRQWCGRLKRGLKSRAVNEDSFRKVRYKAIFARARNQLGWTKADIDNFILDRYGRTSITTLTKRELEQLYNIVMSLKE